MTSTMASHLCHRILPVALLALVLGHSSAALATKPSLSGQPAAGIRQAQSNDLLIEFKADGTYQVKTPRGHSSVTLRHHHSTSCRSPGPTFQALTF